MTPLPDPPDPPDPRETPGVPGTREMMERLRAGGLPPEAAARAGQGMARAAGALRAGGFRGVGSAFFVPGRIEVLGKHTDYAGGRSLLVAVERGFSVVGVAAEGNEVTVLDADGGRRVTLPMDPYLPTRSGWEIYPATVVRRMARDFPGLPGGGAAVAFSSSLPAAAGLSSSSALVVTVFLALAARYQLQERPACRDAFGGDIFAPDLEVRASLAAYLAAVEAGRTFGGLAGEEAGGKEAGGKEVGRKEAGRKGAGGGTGGEGAGGGDACGVGTEGGSEDHAAILCARPGQVVRFRFLPTVFEGAVALPDGWTFAVAASGVPAEKTGGAREAYNRLSAEAAEVAELWRRETGGRESHLGAILSGGRERRRRLEALLERAGRGDLLARVRQFAAECDEIIPGAVQALDAGSLDALGREVDRSQALAEEVLGNQVPETVHLARAARRLGAPAASAFGAGFGGAVWALVPQARADGFLEVWSSDYLHRFPGRREASTFLATGAGPAAFRVV